MGQDDGFQIVSVQVVLLAAQCLRMVGSEPEVWKMTIETARIPVSGSSTIQQAELVYSVAPPWRLRVTLDDGMAFESQQNDLFECLADVRRRLEPEGVFLCCEGARRDVFPSGMARQMGGGRKAYRHSASGDSPRPQLVDIFAPTDCSAVCTVDEQIASLRKLRRG
jgi:hypothetical protein